VGLAHRKALKIARAADRILTDAEVNALSTKIQDDATAAASNKRDAPSRASLFVCAFVAA
jgi:hypothetical protein